jgi:DNA polymerase-3 subunit delta'
MAALNVGLPPWLEQAAVAILGEGNRLHHALLIAGPAGCGQRELGLAMAAARLCEQPLASGLACGRCRACHWLAEGNHPDFRWVRPQADQPVDPEAGSRTSRSAKPSRDIVIDQIRELASFVELGSHRGGERIVLIDPADALNGPAANALLKTLEEPPATVRFLLASERPERLPATVRSRCRRVPLRPPGPAVVLSWLTQSTGARSAQAETALAAAVGAPFAALALLRQADGGEQERIVETLAALPEADPLETAERLSSAEPEGLLKCLYGWLHDLGRCRAGASPLHFPARSARLVELAGRIDLAALSRFEEVLRQQLRWATHPLNPRLFVEDTLLRYQGIFATSGGLAAQRLGGRRRIS